jgi:hypothetical protein
VTEHRSLSWAEKEARRDYIKVSERGGEIVGIVAIVLIALFFYAHQAWTTGFFTSAFGPIEAFFLYGSILISTAGPLARFLTGRRNISRLPELMASIFWIAGSVWLLISFPFNFAHFGDVLPDYLQFLVSWITNDIAKIVLALGTLGGIVFTVLNAILYRKVRRLMRLSKMH